MWHGQTSDPQAVVRSPPKSQRFPPDRWYVMMEAYTRAREPAWWCLSGACHSASGGGHEALSCSLPIPPPAPPRRPTGALWVAS